MNITDEVIGEVRAFIEEIDTAKEMHRRSVRAAWRSMRPS